MKLRWRKVASRSKNTSSETMLGPEAGRNGGNSSTGGVVSEVHEDDAFFDPRPWPVSDGEDDFYSVNGELTPTRVSTPSRSCGSTPTHHQSLSPRATAAASDNGAPSTDPADAYANPDAAPKKRSGKMKTKRGGGAAAGAGRGSPVVPAADGTGGLPPKPSSRTRASSGELGNGRGRSCMGMQCCIPGLGRSKRRDDVEKAADP